MKVSLRMLGMILVAGILIGSASSYYYFSQNVGQLPTIVPNSSPDFTTLSEGDATLYVCPQDACAEKLIAFIDSAQTSVHVMIYSLTLDEVADALMDAHRRGVEVKVLMDNTQAGNQYADDEKLMAAGIPVKIINLPSTHIFHHKVTIVDSRSFSTGSFNYSQNANEGSAENLMMVSNQKMAQQLETAFQQYWEDNE